MQGPIQGNQAGANRIVGATCATITVKQARTIDGIRGRRHLGINGYEVGSASTCIKLNLARPAKRLSVIGSMQRRRNGLGNVG